jgi:hypothetical protein
MPGRLPILIAAAFLVAAAPPPPPAVLAPYLKNGHFEAGDYGWLRSRFPEASAAEKAAGAEFGAWLEKCGDAGEERIRGELAALGVKNPEASPWPEPGTMCAEVVGANLSTRPWPSFAAFSADLAAARPIADTFLWTVGMAVELGGPRGPTLADILVARPLGEQMLRTGWSWGEGAASGAPKLSPGVRAIVMARITDATMKADHENTEYLKAIVAKEGWPSRKAVGDHAAHQAWLLAQHADADPAFQLRALRLMEPMVARDEVPKTDYAYLYDRVMLKLEGRQRYGTQMTCKSGQYVPQPLEREADLDRLRSEAGLEPMAAYRKQMLDAAGPCPPDAPLPKP